VASKPVNTKIRFFISREAVQSREELPRSEEGRPAIAQAPMLKLSKKGKWKKVQFSLFWDRLELSKAKNASEL